MKRLFTISVVALSFVSSIAGADTTHESGSAAPAIKASNASSSKQPNNCSMEKVSYAGWPNCIRLTNGRVELIVTTDVGPRIIRFGFVGQGNEFFENTKQIGTTGASNWRAYGGHRFWLAPESKPWTYHPDNVPVAYEMKNNTLVLTAVTESTTGVQKILEITLDKNANHVTVVHKAINRKFKPITLGPWPLTQMAPGGEAIFPQEAYSPHPAIPDEPGQKIDQKYYLPVRNLVLWSYTKLNDPRFVFTGKYLILKHDPNAKKPQKIGLSNEQNWAAYARNKHLFVKKVVFQPGKAYPDNGCIFEAFSAGDMLEFESLGPLVNLESGATVSHTEDWFLFNNVSFENTDESIDANVLSLVKTVI